jgi:hypothetical protein
MHRHGAVPFRNWQFNLESSSYREWILLRNPPCLAAILGQWRQATGEAAMQTSVALRRGLLGAVLLLAAASLFAAERPAGRAAQQAQAAEAETGAIFSDSMLQSMQGPKQSPKQAQGLGQNATRSSKADKARSAYARGVQALLAGQTKEAEHAAKEAIAEDRNFSDAYALAATAELSQRRFSEAQSLAQQAVRADAASVKARVILATADNYLGSYAAAVEALDPVQSAAARWWQAAYQRARAEAGLEHAQAALDWSNRAALLAPPEFAPLHLLHASALAAAAQYAQAAGELEAYLQIAGDAAPQRAELQHALDRLREQAGQMAKN